MRNTTTKQCINYSRINRSLILAASIKIILNCSNYITNMKRGLFAVHCIHPAA